VQDSLPTTRIASPNPSWTSPNGAHAWVSGFFMAELLKTGHGFFFGTDQSVFIPLEEFNRAPGS